MRTQRTRRACRAALIAVSAGLAACDLPSELPIFQQTWVVPADSVQISVAELLPSSMALSSGTAFTVSVPAPAAFATTLGTLCGQAACQSGGTVNAPVPAFTSSGAALTRTVTFPAGVNSATITAGTLSLQVANSLGFDPLRPNGVAVPYGSIAITITNGAAVATTTFSGTTQAMPTGAVTNLNVPIPTGVYAGSFTVSVALDVPNGNPANLAASNAFSVTPSVTGLTVSQAVVVVTNEPLTTPPSAFDLEDAEFGGTIESGGIHINVENPFTASASLSLQIQAPPQGGGPAVSYTKAVNIPATLTTTAIVTLTRAELESLIGKSGVTITVTGTANGTGVGGTVTVTPAQVLKMRTLVQLTLNVGG